MIDRACEDRLYRTPKFAGVIRYNMLKSCATRVCCACLDEITCVAVMYLTLRTGCERHGRKNPLPFPFSEQSPLSDFRQIRNKGNGIHKGGNLGVYPCAHRRGYGEPPSQVLALIPAPQDTAVKTCRKNWLSTLSTGLSTGYLGITLCIKWITFCIHPRRPPYISVFRLRIVISAVEKPPLHNPPHLVENL